MFADCADQRPSHVKALARTRQVMPIDLFLALEFYYVTTGGEDSNPHHLFLYPYKFSKSSLRMPKSLRILEIVPGLKSSLPQLGMVVLAPVFEFLHISWLPLAYRSK